MGKFLVLSWDTACPSINPVSPRFKMELSTAGPIRMINNIILTRPGLFLPNLLGHE
jgi:hypothetical protein